MQVLALLVLLQVPPGIPIKDWKVQRREANPRTGKPEIVSLIEGAEAVPRSTEKEKEILDVKGLHLRYYTDPRKPGDPVEEIRITSDTARVDNVKDRVDLAGHVHIEKLPLELSEGPDARVDSHGDQTSMDTQTAVLYYHKRFVCPEHTTTRSEPGPCPVCQAMMKQKTFTTIEAPGSFFLARTEPRTRVTGEGLTGSDDLRQMRIARKGLVIIEGPPRNLLPPSPPSAKGASLTPPPLATVPPPTAPASPFLETEMSSSGPMTFAESPSGVIVHAEEKVRILRVEALPDDHLDSTIVTSDRADLVARAAEGDARGGLSPQRLNADGHVTMETRDSTAHGDHLVWDRNGDGEDLTHLEGERASVDTGENHVEARFVTLDRLSGIATFRERVSASLLPGKGPADQQPLRIASRHLETHMAPDSRDFSELIATGDVVLEGLGKGTDAKAGTAEADRFTWNQGENHGLLERHPFVMVRQEDSTIFAPRIVLEGRSTIILKGPKLLIMVSKEPPGPKDAPGKEPQVKETRTSVLTSQGDIVMDSSTDRTVIRMRDRCVVKNSDVQLFSDRMTILTLQGAQGIDSLHASGHVRARQLPGGATLLGEWLDFKQKTETTPQTLTLTGAPRTTIDSGRTTATQDQVRVYEKVDPVTGRTTTFQEMKGGKHGLTIVMDEK